MSEKAANENLQIIQIHILQKLIESKNSSKTKIV